MKYDLGFGNSICVRQAFLQTYNQNYMAFDKEELSHFDYPPYFGDPEVIQITKDIMKRQLNLDYKHVFLTNGATGGVVISLRAYRQRGYRFAHTREAPNYLRYPTMIEASGMRQQYAHQGRMSEESMILLDVPSNPLGLMTPVLEGWNIPIVLDGVYYNNVYTNGNINPLPHDVFVGSYSKLLGLNGIRLGWIATNDDLIAERIKTLVISEYCGLGTANTAILKLALKDFDWDLFETRARNGLNANREEWSKLEKYFGDQVVPDVGMFYYCPMDKQCQALLERSNVIWTKGSALGTSDDFGRFNLGQDVNIIKEVVNTVLRNDRS